MQDLRRHETLEMEALEALNSKKLLDPLVFGGGTMLRLCYGLDRYSVDLDFWMLDEGKEKGLLDSLVSCLEKDYEVTDSCIKRNTILIEIRSSLYPRLLKIEVRRGVTECDWQERIAYSPYNDMQVLLKAHTLEYTMLKKINAALSRKEIRDCFDIEFLLKKGVQLTTEKSQLEQLKDLVKSFKPRDFKVSLGSLLESRERAYYAENGFVILQGKINEVLGGNKA